MQLRCSVKTMEAVQWVGVGKEILRVFQGIIRLVEDDFCYIFYFAV